MADHKSKSVSPTPEQTGVPVNSLDYAMPARWDSKPVNKLLGTLKTLGWVAPLTILIWVYAEREQIATRDQVSVPVEVHLQEPNRVVRLVDPPEPDHNLILTLSGPLSNLDPVIREITNVTSDHPRIQLVIPPKQPRGRQTFSSLALVAANRIFSDKGISVKMVAPTQIAVDIDDLEDRELPVQPPPGLTNLVDEPAFLPSVVKVRAPRSDFENAEKGKKLRLIADITRLDAYKQPGRHDVPSVPLTWEFQGPHVEFSTLAVRTTFEVKLAEQEYTIPALTVFLVLPGAVQDRFEVKYPTTIPNVKVAGPAETIAKLRDESVAAVALLYVNPTKLIPGREQAGLLKFDQPAGVHFVDDTHKELTYQLVERSVTQ